MNIWGKENNANSAPNFIVESSTGGTGRDLFGDQVFLRDNSWVREIEGGGGRENRVTKEILVAFSPSGSGSADGEYVETLTGAMLVGFNTMNIVKHGYSDGNAVDAFGALDMSPQETPLSYALYYVMTYVLDDKVYFSVNMSSPNVTEVSVIIKGIEFDVPHIGQNMFDLAQETEDLELIEGEFAPFTLILRGTV